MSLERAFEETLDEGVVSDSSNESVTDSQNDASLEIGFEGPEKNLQIVFEPKHENLNDYQPLRLISRERWQDMLDLTSCKILSVLRGERCDAYVLSESSLFVYDDRVILKTCGTTKLLHGIDDIVAIGAMCGLQMCSLLYSRKNFTFPEMQEGPHISFKSEVAFLDDRFADNRSVVVAGPEIAASDHWCFYFVNFVSDGFEKSDNGLFFEVKMHELHPDHAALFYNRSGVSGRDITIQSGISDLIPGQVTDEHVFTPCGYSMNGVVGNWYSTVHVTPESHCSYASFETNVPLTCYSALLNKVLAVFRPASFTVTLAANSARNCAPSIGIESGYVMTCSPSVFVLGGTLPVVMQSYAVANALSHPLFLQSQKRLYGKYKKEQYATNKNVATDKIFCGSPIYSQSPIFRELEVVTEN